MSQIFIPGADNHGTTERVPRGPVTEPLKLVTPPTAVPPAPTEPPPPVMTERLQASQDQMDSLPPADDLVEVIKKAREGGVPPEMAAVNPALVPPKGQPRFWHEHAPDGPLSDILADPLKARLAEPDVQNLIKTADALRSWIPENRVARSLKAGELDQRELGIWRDIGDGGGTPSSEQQAALDKINAERRIIFDPQPESLAGRTVLQVVGQAPQLARMGAYSVAGGVAGAVVGAPGVGAMIGAGAASFQMARADAYKTLRDEQIPHKVAYPLSFFAGAVNAGLDMASFGTMTGIFPAVRALAGVKGLEKLTAAGLKSTLSMAVKHPGFLRLVESFATEGTTETAQSIVNWLAVVAGNELAPDPNRVIPTWEQARAQAMQEGWVGAWAGGVFGGASHAAEMALGHVSLAEKNAERLGKVYDVAEGMKLHERDPETLKTYADAVAAGAGAEKVSVPVELLRPVLEKATSEATAKWVQSADVQKRMALADQTGARVTLSMGEFLAHVRPLDEGRRLLMDIGVGGEMSAAEAKDMRVSIEKAQKEIEVIRQRKEAGNDPRVRVYNQLSDQLRAVGYTERAVETQAGLLTSAITALAQRVKMDPEVFYKQNPLAVQRPGTGLRYKLAERLLTMPVEQRIREAYIDPLTGMPNERAFRDTLKQGEQGFYVAQPEGVKWLNDTAAAGHGAADALIRSHARNVLAQDPNAHRGYGGFFGRAATEADAQRIANAVSAASEVPGLGVDFTWGATLDEALQKAQAAKDAEVQAGRRARGGERPKGLAAEVDPDKLAFKSDMPDVPVREDLVKAYTAKTGGEAYSVYVEPDSGLLTSRGMAATDYYNHATKKFIFSADLGGIGFIDREVGNGLADQIIAQSSMAMSALGLDAMDGAHPTGDEFLGRSGGPRNLEALGKKLEAYLRGLTFEAYDPVANEVVTLKGVILGWGVGEGKDAAEQALQKHKEKLRVQGDRNNRNEEQTALRGRLSRRPATEADQGLPRLHRDLGAGDVASRGAASAPAGGGAAVRGGVESFFPGFGAVFGDVVAAQPGQGGKGVRGFIYWPPSRDWFKVTLTGKASLATFLHEGGHYLLELMRKYEQASPEVAADLRALESWAGVAPGEAWSVPALEQFARGFETYLMEGKAPTEGLKSIFLTVKAWMKWVYKTLTNLGAPLTDEVRSVMDRLVAPEEEIAAARTMLGHTAAPFAKDMTAEQRAAYEEQLRQGNALVEARIERDAIAALRKERTEDYKRIKAEVETEVADHPAVDVREYLTNPKQDRYMLLPEALAGRKLSRQALQEMSPGPGWGAKLQAYMSDAPGSLHPDELAPYFGFKSGAALVESLVETPSKQTLVTNMVRERMTDLYPHYDPKGPWVLETAIRRMHESDALATAIETEAYALYKKAGLAPPVAPATVARRAAAENVQSLSYAQMLPAEYINAETHFQREAQLLYAKGDFAGAADATRKRLYSRAMWQAMQTAMDDLQAAKKDIARYDDLDARARIGKSSQAPLPSGAQLGPTLRDAIHALAVNLKLAAAAEKLKPFSEMVADIRNAGLPVAIDEIALESVVNYQKWDYVPYDLAMAAYAAVKNLRHLASEANKITVGGRKAEIQAIADGIVRDLVEAGLYQRLGREGTQNSVGRNLRAEIERPEKTCLDAAGGKVGTLHEVLIQTAEDGQFEAERRRALRLVQYRELAKARPEHWHRRMAEKHVGFDGETYTGAEVFAMLLNLGTLSNEDKLIRGYGERAARPGWSKDNVLTFIHKVFPDRAAYDYAKAHWNFISQASLWEDSAAVNERLFGVRPVKVEGQAIPTPDGGSVAGGYYPIIYDKRVPTVGVDNTHSTGIQAMIDIAPAALYAKHGFTNLRTSYAAPILLDPTAFAAHVYEVDHFISNAEGVLTRHRVLTNPQVKNALVQSLGYERWENLRNSNNFIAADGNIMSREKMQFDGILNRLIYNNALLVMGGNILSGVNQVVSGLPATLAQLGPGGVGYFARALIEFTKAPFKAWEDVSKVSGEFRSTDFHFDRDLRTLIAREMTGDTYDLVRGRMASVTMTPVVFGQKLINVVTWMAANMRAIDEGKTEAEAVRVANSAVRQSQSAAGPKDLAAVQRSHDGLRRVLTSLASYTFALNDLVMPSRLTKKEVAGATGRLLMMTMAAITMKALYEALLPELAKEDEERRKGLAKWGQARYGATARLAIESLLDTVGNVPLVGRTTQAVLDGREPRYASWVDSGLKFAESIPKVWEEKGLSKADVKAAADTVGLITGIPTRHLVFAPGEFMYEAVTRHDIDPSPWTLFQHLALVRPGQKGQKP